MSLASKSMRHEQGKVNIAVVLLRHLSNFTDFNVLERDSRVHLFYTNNVDELQEADIILLPGTKSTLDDLYELRRNGVAQAILRAHRRGTVVMGICGGYQMMGQEVTDPSGLGLLPVSTRMDRNKVTRQVKFHLKGGKPGCTCKGYEIHMGVTTQTGDVSTRPLNVLEDGTPEGCLAGRTCMGTYIHGILDNPEFIDFLLEPFREKMIRLPQEEFDYHLFKERQYDKLAEHVRSHVDMPLIYQFLKNEL